MRKKHGQHNLDLTEIIFNKKGFNDWVVTTAFYSSVHFVEHALFPLIENGIEYPDFNDYWDKTCRGKIPPISKHRCKATLVRKYISTVSVQYRDLLEECHTARYNHYQVEDLNALRLKMCASEVKDACLAMKP